MGMSLKETDEVYGPGTYDAMQRTLSKHSTSDTVWMVTLHSHDDEQTVYVITNKRNDAIRRAKEVSVLVEPTTKSAYRKVLGELEPAEIGEFKNDVAVFEEEAES